MSALAALAFVAPWWLLALAGLPILYWLLRVTPPAPRLTRFPAIRLLFALKPKEETPAQTPWWLLLLRLLIATLIILALAHPLLNPGTRLERPGPLLLVIDDGWASARNWLARQNTLASLFDRAEREQRAVMLLATAPQLGGEPPRTSRLMRAADARSAAAAIEPKPWPVDRDAARAALDAAELADDANIVYLADGLDDGRLIPLIDGLQRIGPVDVVREDVGELPRLLLPPIAEAAGLAVTAMRFTAGPPGVSSLRALADDGRLLAREELRWPENGREAKTRVELPIELRNRLARLEIEGEASAGAVVLLDERWRRRPVGLVASGSLEKRQPLLADIYYLERALTPFVDLRFGAVAELLQRGLAVLVLADIGRLSDEEHAAIEPWVRKGGVLVRFAGPRSAQGTDDLVPVPLRTGGDRAFGGAMSWEQPVGLQPFESSSLFAGLAVPEDVRVVRQILAEPSLDLAERTWARLADGTPLVTADRRGDGWLVMMHTTANPEWSSLPISGLFVEMLRRLVGLSQGVAGDPSEAVLPPFAALDGFGRLQAPPPAAVGIEGARLAETSAGPRHPPGYYGNETTRRTLNLSAALLGPQAPLPKPMAELPGSVTTSFYLGAREVDFKPWLLAAALALGLVDLLIALALRGIIGRLSSRSAAAALAPLLAFGAPGAALAQQTPLGQAAAAHDDDTARASTLTTRFAFVRTNSGEIDEISAAGLAGLGQMLSKRTTIDPAPPVGVDVEHDELAFYPLIYWPVLPEAPRPSAGALARIAQFLRQGGMIVFDTRDGGGATGATTQTGVRLREILRPLNLPALTPVPADHVLTKSFYLLSEFPGRWAGAPVWVEQADDRINDGVSSVIIGAHDWAAAWANDGGGKPLFAAVPGGEAQREIAVRFGVNLVMYALTGNYKADQVHVEAILDRLRR